MNFVYLHIFLINLKKRESKRSWEDAVALTDKTIVLYCIDDSDDFKTFPTATGRGNLKGM